MEETEPMPREKKGNWHEDPVRRAEVLEKMRQGRERYYEERRQKAAVAPPSAPDLAEGEPDYFALMRGLKGTRWDRMPLDLAESLMGIIDEARREGMGRIQARRERETANRCSYCHDLFPGHGTPQGGRYFDAKSWHDLETMGIVSKLCCAKIACRNALVSEADRERRRRLEARG